MEKVGLALVCSLGMLVGFAILGIQIAAHVMVSLDDR
jgi:hypothetical protein